MILRAGPLKKKNKSGFTLIELIAVMLLISLMMTFAMPKVSNIMGFNLRSGATQMAGYLRSAYEYSVMHHQKIRVRLDLEKGSYWVESKDESLLIPLLDENVKIDEVMEKFEKRGDEMNSLDAEEKTASDEKRFKKVEDSFLKDSKLPQSIQFKGIYTSAEGKIINTGTPWIDFSPGGFVPKTIVYIQNDSDQMYSIILEPLVGRSRIEKGEVRPDEL